MIADSGFVCISTWTGSARRDFMDTFQARCLYPEIPYKTRRYRSVEDPTYRPSAPTGCGRKYKGIIDIVDDRDWHWPDHRFPSLYAYEVTGDDGSKWEVGSKGNSDAVIRAEVLACDRLLSEEKAEVLRWMDEQLPEQRLIPRIRAGVATEAEIRAAHLPSAVEENLLYNLRNWCPFWAVE